jgi:hypothetical protein
MEQEDFTETNQNKDEIKSQGEDFTPIKNRMTGKQRLFLDEYLNNGLNQTKAYMTAYQTTNYDYAKSQASAIIAKPNSQAYLASVKSKLAKQYDIKREDNIKQILEVIKGSENAFVKLKAIDMLNKMGGFYIDKPQVNIQSTGQVTVDFGGYNPNTNKEPDDELPISNTGGAESPRTGKILPETPFKEFEQDDDADSLPF